MLAAGGRTEWGRGVSGGEESRESPYFSSFPVNVIDWKEEPGCSTLAPGRKEAGSWPQ